MRAMKSDAEMREELRELQRTNKLKFRALYFLVMGGLRDDLFKLVVAENLKGEDRADMIKIELMRRREERRGVRGAKHKRPR